MPQIKISCPNCNQAIPISAVAAAPFISAARKTLTKRLTNKEQALAKQAKQLLHERVQLSKVKGQLERQFAERLAAERRRAAQAAVRKSDRSVSKKLRGKEKEAAHLRRLVERGRKEVEVHRRLRATLARQRSRLEHDRRTMDQAMERRLATAAQSIRHNARLRPSSHSGFGWLRRISS